MLTPKMGRSFGLGANTSNRPEMTRMGTCQIKLNATSSCPFVGGILLKPF